MESNFSVVNNSDGLNCFFRYHEDLQIVDCNGTIYDPPKKHLTSSDPTFWIFIALYIFLVLVCGLMQGLVLAMCSLDMTDLKVTSQAGSEKTRKYAKRMIPFAERHHLVLVTLIIANATAATAMPIFFERLTSPVIAIVVSATAFLIFGEILPQSICSKYALPIGYYMSWVVWALTGLFFIFSYPASLFLDWLLGKDSGTLYKRTELSALVDMHGPVVLPASDVELPVAICGRRRTVEEIEGLERLSADEVLVIKGALAMGQKKASEVMVKLEDVFMLPSDAVFDEALVQEIWDVGHSRIPVYEGKDRTNVIGVFLTKRLILVDPKQALSIGTIFQSPDAVRALYPPYMADEHTPLYDLLNQFQTGTCTHMAFITTTEKSKTKIIGIVTMEDLIEELLQEEIRDESDLQRQWRLQVAKVKVVHRFTKDVGTHPSNLHPLTRHLSAPSLLALDAEDKLAAPERKNSLSYIS